MTNIAYIRQFDLSKMPSESEPLKFRENASYAWDTLVGVAQDYNKSIGAINSIIKEARVLSNSITNDKNRTYNYMQDAQKAMQVASNVVIPTSATYSKETVDGMLNALLTEQVRQNLQINILQK